MIDQPTFSKNQNNFKTVIVGMSGGVDSSVAALILKQQGYNVIGVFMKNWEELDQNGVCQSAKEYQDVIEVCQKIGIAYYSLEFVKEYKERVFADFVAEYQAGYTPNPDILCNREIKFKVFFERALQLGADYLATGHYCQNQIIDNERRLVKGRDPGKDQSYFLYTIKKQILDKVLFPIGGMLKSQVREMAQALDLSVHNKKDSTGICFIGERNFKNFLSNYIQTKPGNFEDLDGQVVGQHDGAAYYTIGQRQGLGLGGQGSPWYVLDKDTERNVVMVGRGHNHPALFSNELSATEISWVSGEFNFSVPFKCKAKVRYRQADQDCTITRIQADRLHVVFDDPQRGVAPRQSIVFYQNNTCLGGAIIEKSFNK